MVGAALLIIFTSYYVSVTYFPHTHIIDGITIVHSHPFKSLPDKNPAPHSHSQNALILIHFLSVIQVLVTVAFAGLLLFGELTTPAKKRVFETSYFSSHNLSFHRPRAPTL